MFTSQKKLHQTLPILYLSLILGACSQPPKAATMPPILVEIGQGENEKISTTSEYIVGVKSLNLANIRPRVTGYVKRVLVKVGDRVNKGDLLFEIDQSKQQALLDSKVAAVGTAKANLESAQATLQAQKAERQRISSELEYNSQQAKVQGTQADLSSQLSERDRLNAELQLNSYQAKLDEAKANLNSQLSEKQKLLAELELNSYKAKLDDAQAVLRSVKAQRDKEKAALDYQKVDYQRNQQLYKDGVYAKANLDIATKNLQTSEATLRSQEEDVQASEAKVASAQKDLDRFLGTTKAQIETQDKIIQSSEAKLLSAQRDLERFLKTTNAQLASQNQVIQSKTAAVASSEKDKDRTITSLQAQLASQDQVIQAQLSNIASLQDQLRTAQANATQEQVQLEYYQITAPFSGTISAVPVKEGDSVETQTQLTTISQSQPLEVSIQIPLERLSKIRKGTPVLLLDASGKEIDRVSISDISPQTDEKTQTILVKALYSNANNKLRTDQQIRAKVIWEQQPGVTVPFAAVKRIGGQDFVFVVEEKSIDGKKTMLARQKPVKLGPLQGNNYEIISGLEGKEPIVISGVVKLKDGAPFMDKSKLPKEPDKTPSTPGESMDKK